jgi:Family of unknown function (DUF6084)
MPELNFAVENVRPVPYAAAPWLAFQMRVANRDLAEPIHSVILQCQIQIEAPRRAYTSDEQARLLDLFGEPERWGQTLRSMLWTHASVNVPPFSGSTKVDLPVSCTFDFNVAATKYFHALEHGEVPLCLLFSGTIFYEDASAGLQVTRIPWSEEARYRLPVALWKQLIDLYYPNTAWLTLRRDVFDQLDEYKRKHGIVAWDQVMERLLARANQREAPQTVLT